LSSQCISHLIHELGLKKWVSSNLRCPGVPPAAFPDSHLTHSTEWCADSGATSHMTRLVCELHSPCHPHYGCIGNIIHSAGIGKVKFQPVLRGAPRRLVVLHQVLHVPCLSRPLLSMTKLTMDSSPFKIVMWKDPHSDAALHQRTMHKTSFQAHIASFGEEVHPPPKITHVSH
jgi:hypothetical protein